MKSEGAISGITSCHAARKCEPVDCVDFMVYRLQEYKFSKALGRLTGEFCTWKLSVTDGANHVWFPCNFLTIQNLGGSAR